MKKIFLSIFILISITAFSQEKFHFGKYRYDSLCAALFLKTLDTTNKKLVVVGSDGKFYKMNWQAVGSTPGIDAVLAVAQNMTASRSINTTGSYKLTIGNAAPGASSGFQVDLTSNATDATGDLYYRTSNGPMGRIPTGTTKQLLHPDGSGGYVWKDTTAVPTVTNPIQILNSQYTDAGNVSTSETDLMTYTVGSGQLQSDGDWLEVEGWFNYAANANTKTLKFKFGSYVGTVSSSSVTSSGGSVKFSGKIIRTGATSQRIVYSFEPQNGTTYKIITSGSETLSGTVVLKFTGQSDTATDDIIQKTMQIVYHHYTP